MKNLLISLFSFLFLQTIFAQPIPDSFGFLPTTNNEFRDESFLIDSTKCYSINLENAEEIITSQGVNIYNGRGQLIETSYSSFNPQTGEEAKSRAFYVRDENYLVDDFYVERWDENTSTWVKIYLIDYTPTPLGSTRTVYYILDEETNELVLQKRQTVTSFYSIGEPNEYWQELWINDSWVYEWKLSQNYNEYGNVAASIKQSWDVNTSSWVFSNQNFFTYEEGNPNNMFRYLVKSWDGNDWQNTVQITYRNYSSNGDWENQLTETWDNSTGEGFWKIQGRVLRTFNDVDLIETEIAQGWDGTDFFDGNRRQFYLYNSDGNRIRHNNQLNVNGEWVTQAYCLYFWTLHVLGTENFIPDFSVKMENPYRAGSPILLQSLDGNEQFAVNLVSLSGETVMQRNVTPGRIFHLNTTPLAVGIYVMRVTDSKGRFGAKKMVIIR